jgi:hypothetical protein
MTSTPIAEIARPDLGNLPTPPTASITEVKYLASYNWIEAPTPTIAIPGCPPLWSPPSFPRRLKKDSGYFYIAQNAARHPDSPLEPLFRALYVTDPSFDIRSIDVVSDRNNIRKLLSYIDPSTSRNGLQEFTIEVEITKNTAMFCRKETAVQEFIGPHEFKGYGHEFEKVYTKSRINRGTGHHRMISYRFGNLNFIIRHETNGYVADATSPNSNTTEPEDDSLSSTLASLSLSSAKTASYTPPAGSKLTIKREGQVVPLQSTLEIKTRVAHRRLEFREIAPQLWVSGTPKLVRAYHNRGMFQQPEVEDVSAEINRWEEANQGNLRKLAALITRILQVVKGCGGNAVVKYSRTGDKLVIWKAEAKKILPEDLYSKWDDGDDSEADTDTG